MEIKLNLGTHNQYGGETDRADVAIRAHEGASVVGFKLNSEDTEMPPSKVRELIRALEYALSVVEGDE